MNIRGMSMQLFRLLMLAGICAISLLALIHVCSDLLIDKYFTGSELQLQMTEKRIENFEKYISENALSATDAEELIRWCNKQPMVLMEIYRNNLLYFNSNYSYADPLIDQNIEMIRYDWYSYYVLQFTDGPADVLIYSDESYILSTWITIGAITLSGLLFLAIVLIGIRKTIRYIYLLCDEIQIMGSGDLEHPVTVMGSNELGLLAQELDHMRSALFFHRKREQDMIRQNNDMITGLSHDLRTPLTKLMLYTEIINSNRDIDEQQMGQYLTRINEKSIQIKGIAEHLLKYSISQQETKTDEIQPVSFRAAFFDRLSEMTDYLSQQGFTVECDVDWSEAPININELYLDRILDNIVSNIEKYAEKTYPVEIRTVQTNHFVGIAVKNMQSPTNERPDSNGVGIDNMCTMMQEMNGSCKVDQSKTVFEISLLFSNE